MGFLIPAALAGAQFFGNRNSRRSAERSNQRGVNEARGYLNQIEPIARGALSPYIRNGLEAEGNLPGIYQNMYEEYANNQTPSQYENNEIPSVYGEMSSDPKEFINNIMRGYTPSEGYKYKEKRMTDAARAAGAAGGFAGTELDRESQAEMIKGLLGGDIQEFLNNVMNTQRYGLEGTERYNERNMLGKERYNERNMLGKERARALGAASQEQRSERGFRGASDLINILGSNLGQQAGLGIMGNRQSQTIRNEANRNNMDMFGRMMDMYQSGSFGNMSGPFGGR